MTTRTTSTKTTMTAFYLIGNEDIDNTRPTHQSAQHNNQPYKKGGEGRDGDEEEGEYDVCRRMTAEGQGGERGQ